MLRGELDIGSLLEAPLIAITKANSAMSGSQTEFLLGTCFEKNSDGEAYLAVTVNIEVISPTTDGVMVFQLPLISILPINTLAVNSVELDFRMEVTSMAENGLKGRVSSSTETRKDLNVSVKAGPLPLSKGVLTLIDIYSCAIRPVTSDNPKTSGYESRT